MGKKVTRIVAITHLMVMLKFGVKNRPLHALLAAQRCDGFWN
jgi:hypothetical protein